MRQVEFEKEAPPPAHAFGEKIKYVPVGGVPRYGRFFGSGTQRPGSEIGEKTHGCLGDQHFLDYRIPAEGDDTSPLEHVAPKELMGILEHAAQVAEATVFGSSYLETDDGNRFAVVGLMESHFSLDIVNDYVLFEDYTCGTINGQAALSYLKEALRLPDPDNEIRVLRGIYDVRNRDPKTRIIAKFEPYILQVSPGDLIARQRTHSLQWPVLDQQCVATSVTAELFGSPTAVLNDGNRASHVYFDALAQKPLNFSMPASEYQCQQGFERMLKKQFPGNGLSLFVARSKTEETDPAPDAHASEHNHPEHRYAPHEGLQVGRVDPMPTTRQIAKGLQAEEGVVNVVPRGLNSNMR